MAANCPRSRRFDFDEQHRHRPSALDALGLQVPLTELRLRDVASGSLSRRGGFSILER